MTQAANLAALGSNASSTGTLGASSFASATIPNSALSGNPTFRNRIINGNMMINQRSFSGSITSGTNNVYTLDRWKAYITLNDKFTVSQNAGSVTPPTGFKNYLGCTSSAATSPGSSDYYMMAQFIEGYNVADLQWGTANAKTVTLSFWVRSSLTGTFGGSLTNDNQDRSYPFSYTIASANTWTNISVTIAGDTTGTWATDNGTGLKLFISLGVGSSFQGTAGAWAGATYFSCTGETQVIATNGATLYYTGVQLEVGTTATNFDFRDYGRELILCQRYYIAYTVASTSTSWSVNSSQNLAIGFPVQMRATPTYKGILSGAWQGNSPGENYNCKDGYCWYQSGYFYGNGSLVTGFDAEL